MRPTSDCSIGQDALRHAREHLEHSGFTAAPCSDRLIRRLREVPEEQLGNARWDFKKCVGRSKLALSHACSAIALNPHITIILNEAREQLQTLLPTDAVVVGLVEGAYRHGGISWLHFDEIRNSDQYVQQVLFPSATEQGPEEPQNAATYNFDHYHEVRMLIEAAFPGLSWPSAELVYDKEGETQIVEHIKAAILKYNSSQDRLGDPLAFECINVWIPKAEKQIALLAPEHLKDSKFYDTRPSVEEIEKAGFQDSFESFGRGVSTFFFGRYVLHQAAEGPQFTLSEGSMEMRYLVLLPQSKVPWHRRIGQGAPAQMCAQEGIEDVSPDAIGPNWPW